jgi:hypothetical protein
VATEEGHRCSGLLTVDPLLEIVEGAGSSTYFQRAYVFTVSVIYPLSI